MQGRVLKVLAYFFEELLKRALARSRGRLLLYYECVYDLLSRGPMRHVPRPLVSMKIKSHHCLRWYITLSKNKSLSA